MKNVVAAMRLWVIRHADAVRSGPGGDATRPLSEHGRQQASRLAEALGRSVRSGIILCSPILRARQTAHALQRSLPDTRLVESDSVSTSGSVDETLRELRRLIPADVLIVSHEPLVSRLVTTLASNGDHVHFHPATAALLEGDAGLLPRTMRLRDVVVPDSGRPSTTAPPHQT